MSDMKPINRVLLLAKISEDTEKNISTILSDGEGTYGVDEAKIREIDKALGAKSFDEFLEKFAPRITTVVNSIGEASWKSIDVDQKMGNLLNLDYPLLKMLCDMMEKRGNSGMSTEEFDYQSIFNMLRPKQIMEDAKQIRGEFSYKTKKYLELDDKNPEKKIRAKDIITLRQKIAQQYKENPMNLLALAIHDCEAKLEGLPEKSGDKDNVETPKIGYYNFDDKGEVRFIEYQNGTSVNTGNTDKQADVKMIEWVEKDYDTVISADNKNEFTKALVRNSFAPSTTKGDIDVEKVKENLVKYKKVYETQVDGFYKSLKPLIQTLLGVKAFFDQNPVKNETLLIVANQTPEQLDKNKDRLKKYLESCNGSYNENNIWTAIIPGISEGGAVEEDDDIDIDMGIDIENVEESNVSGNIGSVKSLMEVMASNKIQTFINFESNENTSFLELQKNGIESFKNQINNSKFKASDYMIPCYPNFTILNPKDSVAEGDISVGGVYVDAAFVAAGLINAQFNPKSLKKFGFKNIDNQIPGVSINLEGEGNAFKVLTSMGKESNIGIIKSIRDEINEYNTGFIFFGESMKYEGKDISNMYVYKARNLNKQPIYKRFTADFIGRYINYETQGDLKRIQDYVKRTINEDWKDNSNKDNSLLKNIPNEVEIKEHKLVITFKDDINPTEIEVEIK